MTRPTAPRVDAPRGLLLPCDDVVNDPAASNRGSPRGAPLVGAAAAGVLAGCIAGLADALLTALRGAFAAGLPLAACGVMALVGGVLAPPAWLLLARARDGWSQLGAPRPGAPLLLALAAGSLVLALLLDLAGAALFVRRTPPARLHSFAWAALGSALIAGVGARGLAALVQRWPRLAAPVALGLGLAAAAILRAGLQRAAELDLRFLVVLGVYAGALALLMRRRPPTRPRRIALAGLGLGLLALVLLAASPGVRLVAARYSPLSGRLARVAARLADLDADGFSPLGGEGDCAPLDPSVHPFAADRPGDGVDQDCHAGDLDPAVLPPPPAPMPLAPPAGPRPNVILISVETLRADHLGLYGYARATTPEIDAFFADAAVFERAYTVSPVTDRTLPSWLGGMLPSMYVEALDYDAHVLSPARVLLPERLQAAGYRTIVLQSFHLFDDHGLAQGIDELEVLHHAGRQDARFTTRLAARKVDEHLRRRPEQPLFLWVHYYEPHARYTPPDAHRIFGDADLDRYDGEIHYVDAEIGRLLDHLQGAGVLAGAYVALTADHGEEFLEHGRTQHAYAIYEESVRVPWMVRGPDIVARRIAAPVSLLDLSPTLLDLIGLPVEPGLDARSEAAALRGGAVQRPWLLIEQFQHGTDHVQKIALIEGDAKMILDLDHQLWELYDLARDPGERDNLDGRDLERSLRMRRRILDHRARSQAARLLAEEAAR